MKTTTTTRWIQHENVGSQPKKQSPPYTQTVDDNLLKKLDSLTKLVESINKRIESMKVAKNQTPTQRYTRPHQAVTSVGNLAT